MRKTIKLAIMSIVAALVLAVPSTTQAATFNDRASGSGTGTETTTLNYAKPHGDFNTRIWITRSGLPQFGVNTKYSIKMYDKYGRMVWSAQNQGDRTYKIGWNVTKIVVTPNTKWFSLTTRWQRK